VLAAVGIAACVAGSGPATAGAALASAPRASAAAGGSPEADARAAGAAFLARYVLPGGRSVRLDQGSDTVGAGQAQALLISAALGNKSRFAAIWRWTRAHMLRPRGLLAARWRAGHVVNAQSASDADLDLAHALLLGGARFSVPAYRAAGIRVGNAILAQETTVIAGMRVLLAGTWTRRHRPAAINPSYADPRALQALAAATHDRRFTTVARGSARIAAALMAPAPHLPPDWAAVTANGAVHPTGVPGLRAKPQFSLDAARLPVRYAEGCDQATTTIAAAPWPFFASMSPDRIGLAYGLDGRPLSTAQAAVTLVGAAASAQAAGHPDARDLLLAQAAAVNARFPTYYGAAWLALGRIGLTTELLGTCAA
jgi:endoglucanase